jgi:hypothetical protein
MLAGRRWAVKWAVLIVFGYWPNDEFLPLFTGSEGHGELNIHVYVYM